MTIGRTELNVLYYTYLKRTNLLYTHSKNLKKIKNSYENSFQTILNNYILSNKPFKTSLTDRHYMNHFQQ